VAFARALELDGITMRFAGRPRPVLEGFSRTIQAGAVVAVTGPSGSGKSTLADILAGLVAPNEGVMRVDGLAIDGERRIRWRRQVAYVEQVPYLLDASIAANLAWGLPHVERGAFEAALRDASAEFVLALPDGLDTLVGEIGRELSGGERQRISFARALLRRPSLIILDEVTAALDDRNEAAIGRTIERLRGSATFVILGHRPALRALADAVIELGDG
jgi:ATP-binding cassette subfamily C protein